MLKLKNEAMNHTTRKEREKFKMRILAKLGKLEEEILKSKGKKREEATETYRDLLGLLEEEPIYLKRYE